MNKNKIFYALLIFCLVIGGKVLYKHKKKCSLYNYITAQNSYKLLANPDAVILDKITILDNLNQNDQKQGLQEMKKHKAIIVGISRDNVLEFPVMKKTIETIGDHFADYKVVIFENDSTDGTKYHLKSWSLINKKVQIILENYHVKKRPNIEFLANCRNQYLHHIQNEEYKDFDLVIVIDMDMIFGIDMRGLIDSFSKFSRWDAVCSNGIYTKSGKMSDGFAFRNEQFPYTPEDAHYWDVLIPKIINHVFAPGTDLIKVDSCFGGMAVYKKKSIKNCMYFGYYHQNGMEDCEHVSFHRCLREKNNAKIFMNPNQVIRYSHYDESK